jgi:hypothetical protein
MMEIRSANRTSQSQSSGCFLVATTGDNLVNLRVPPVPKVAIAVLPLNANLSVVHCANEQLLVFQRPCWPV